MKIALLVLGSTRFIASGCCFNLIEELACVRDEKWGLRASKVHITMPKTKEEMRDVMGLYKRNGYSGCVSSVDCVRVIWNKWYSSMQEQCTGKEKVHILVFQAAYSHTRRMLSASNYIFCTYNHKTVSKYDYVMQHLKNDTLYKY